LIEINVTGVQIEDIMSLFVYCCPKTGARVQGFAAEDIAEDRHSYEPVTCPACRQIHKLIRPLARS